MTTQEHREHCLYHNMARTMWIDPETGETRGYRCICERREGERRVGPMNRRADRVAWGHGCRRTNPDRRQSDD